MAGASRRAPRVCARMPAPCGGGRASARVSPRPPPGELPLPAESAAGPNPNRYRLPPMRTIPGLTFAAAAAAAISIVPFATATADPPTQEALIPATAKLEKIVSDLKFSEGPAWTPKNVLLFEDVPRNRTLQLDPTTNKTT